MGFENITRSDQDGVTTVTINRPDKLNALNAATIGELLACFAALGEDESVRAVILTGAGPKAFVAGADISELAQQTAITARPLALRGQQLMSAIEACPKPVVAAINGFALGGGCELAIACHLRTAAENAVFGLPEVTLGIIPGYGGTQRLPRIIGRGRALEMILTANRVSAQEALAMGLVNKVWPADKLLAETDALLRRMLAAGPVAVRYALDAVNHGADMPLHDGLNYEATFFGLLAATEDCREGMTAFMEKRPARFKGR